MNTTKQTLRIYWQHAWRYPKYVVALIAIVPFATVLYRIIPPLIAADVIRRLSLGNFASGQFWSSFSSEIIIFTFVTLFGGVFLYRLDIYLAWKLETFVNRDLLRTMFNHYMKLDSGFHADSFGGSLVSRANKLVGSYIRLAETIVFQLMPFIGSFFAVMVIMYPKSPVFVWAFFVFSVVFIVATFLLSKRVREYSAIQANAENSNTGALADAVTNVMAVKSFSAFKSERQKFNDVTDDTRKKALKTMWATLVRDFAASIVTSSLLIMSLVVAIMAVVNQDANLAIVFLMLNYTAYLTDHLWQFSSSTLRNFNRSMGDAYEATQTLLTKPAISDPKNPEPLRVSKGHIVFDDVVFDHNDNDDENSLFKNLNLEIKPGEKIGLVGRSGGGKTTITKLLLRFMDIDGGEIRIDDQNIASVAQDDLRSVISYVPQEPLLFHRSLVENISYGNPEATEKAVIQVAKHAHAHEFIEKLPKGYETLVGERGVKLSGGQRQRVAIARAMLKDAPILLLDEATSALDSESEILIQDALWKLMENKTAIVIAHRLSTIQKMDRIIVLNDGNVVEDGNHRDLLAKNGTYAKLWAHQSGGFLED